MTFANDAAFYLALSAAVLATGARLTRDAEWIATRFDLGRGWIGATLIAGATSFPELATGLSAVGIHKLPDIAVGDALGSLLYNLALLALLDALLGRRSLFAAATPFDFRMALYGLGMVGLALVAILMGPLLPSLGWVSVASPIILVTYAAVLWSLYRLQKPAAKPLAKTDGREPAALRLVLTAANILVLVAAVWFLPEVAARIAEATGLGPTVFGTVFVAFTTSLPEVVVAVAAIRLNAIGLAIGDLLGSNLFDVAILAIDDFVYTPGFLFAVIDLVHGITVVGVLLGYAFVLAAIRRKPTRKFLALSFGSWGLVATYVGTLIVLFVVR
jgi:cation:H+ antiporter